MSKVVKIAAAVAGVAAIVASAGSLAVFGTTVGASFFGIGVSTLGLISTGLAIGASLLAKRPKAPQAPRDNLDRLQVSIDPRAPRKLVIGTTAMATDIRDQEYTGGQDYLHRFIVVASHKVHEITEIWFENERAWSLSGGVQGDYSGYLTVAPILEGSAANAINISSRMGSTRRFTGLAYVHLRFKLTGNSKKSESPFSQSIPTRVTIRGDGAFMYDPRLDSTVPGGSGSHRADDQSTWTWTDGHCNNPAIQLLWYLLGWKINGKLAVGKGIPAARIDLESFAIAANICDEPVALSGGGTEPRYRAKGVFSEANPPLTVVDNLKACMNADLDDVDGKLRLTIFRNDLATPIASFSDDDIIGSFDWQNAADLDQTFNIVRGVYTDPSDESLYQAGDYPEVTYDSVDGIDRIDAFDLPYVESVAQAQRLAWLRLRRQRYGAGRFSATLKATGWRAEKNAIVTLSFTPLGFVNKLFRVASIQHNIDGTVPIELVEENLLIYGDGPEDVVPDAPIAPSVYNPLLSPLNQAINETGIGAAIAGSYTIGLSGSITQEDNGVGGVTITIPTHTRMYPSPYGAVSVTGGTLTVAYEEVCYIYYDDPSLAGGAVTYGCTSVAQDSGYSASYPYRHFVGLVVAMNSGGAGGSADGGGIPPWNSTL